MNSWNSFSFNLIASVVQVYVIIEISNSHDVPMFFALTHWIFFSLNSSHSRFFGGRGSGENLGVWDDFRDNVSVGHFSLMIPTVSVCVCVFSFLFFTKPLLLKRFTWTHLMGHLLKNVNMLTRRPFDIVIVQGKRKLDYPHLKNFKTRSFNEIDFSSPKLRLCLTGLNWIVALLASPHSLLLLKDTSIMWSFIPGVWWHKKQRMDIVCP